jgi:hypothetical protein
MKYIPIIFLCLCSFAFAQERWDGQDSIWVYGNGGPNPMIDPCFGPDVNSVLLMNPETNRIVRLDYLDADTLIPFLPESLSIEGYADMSPFLTAYGDSLYFSSNRPGGYGGYDIWVTGRIDGVWQMPVNLGPNINSLYDETGPSLNGSNTEIFFCVSTESSNYGYISRSLLVNGHWTPLQQLPAQINTEYGERAPSVTHDGRFLYFISRVPIDTVDHSAWVCERIGDEWTQRILLDGFINHLWQVCAFMPEGNPYTVAVDRSGMRLIYTKEEVYECIDSEVRLYMSHLSTSINNDIDVIPRTISLSLYPNPFNSSLAISVSGAAVSEIAIYDLLGQQIRTFSDITNNSVVWDGHNNTGIACASGIYFVRDSSGERAVVRSATLLK